MLKQTLALGAMLLSTGLIAEPDKNVKFLMSEPFTLFDYGLYRIQSDLEKLNLQSKLEVMFSPKYDWDKNRIILGFKDFDTSTLTKEAAREKCDRAIFAVREHFGVDGKTGELLPFMKEGLGSSKHQFYFAHIGYESTRAPKELYKSLDSITEISGDVLIYDDKRRFLNCKGDLLSNKTMYSE